MANRAWTRNIATLTKELVLLEGVITLSGSTFFNTGSNADFDRGVITCNIPGTVPTVFSSSNGVVATGETKTLQAPVTRVGSGSYQVDLSDVYPSMKAAHFDLSMSGSTQYDWRVVPDLATTRMGSVANAAAQRPYQPGSTVGFLVLSSSGGVSAPADPKGNTFNINVSLALKNSVI